MRVELLTLTWLSSLLIAFEPAPARALERPQKSLRALLEAADLDGNDVDPAASGGLDEDPTWLIRDVLRWDFAHTPTARRQVAGATDQLRWERERRWLEEVDRRSAVARLRPMHPHPSGTTYDIPMMDHHLVDAWIEHFTGRGRRFFERWLARADRYAPIMLPILQEAGLPRDTIYLAMIESGFVSHALSRSAASGFWQFIASTGREYRLRQDSWVDERRDFIKATKSAAKYLGKLHRRFGDWHLAWAGYNAGGGRVSRALARHGVEDFWTLIEQKGGLAKETQHYVPKIIAAAVIAKNREFYGFGHVQSLPQLSWDEVRLESPISLRRVAAQLDVPIADLRTLNPELLYDLTPPGRPYTLRVPTGDGEQVAQWLESLPRSKRFKYGKYVVQAGDTLAKIARRHGTSIHAITEFNSIHDAHRIRPGQRLIIPALPARKGGDRTVVAKASQATKKRTNTTPARAQKQPPKAAAGDGPQADVSEVSGTIVASASTPSASKKRAAKGPPPAEASVSTPSVSKQHAAKGPPPAKAKKRSPTIPVASHVVAPGDTLWSIAQRYGVSVNALRNWNRRPDNSLSVGDVLMIF